MSRRKKPDLPTIQSLLNQLSYEDFIAMLAVLADQHPEGGVKQIQAIGGGKHCVIYLKSFDSLDEALEIIRRIEGTDPPSILQI